MAKKIKNPRGIGPRRKDEKAYERLIKTEILNPLFQNTMNRLESVPKFKTAFENVVNQEFLSFTSTENFGVSVATEAVDNLRRVQKAQIIKNFQAALGIDINPFMSDLNIRAAMNQAVFDNVALIKSIPQRLNLEIVSVIQKTFEEKGFDEQEMIRVIENRFKVAGNRAKLIASDQTGKIIGNLNEARQTDIGVTSYKWRTMEDEAVVGTPGGLYPRGNPKHMNHFERDGVVFLWAAPPPDGHPGQAINCRCFAQAIIPGLELQEAA